MVRLALPVNGFQPVIIAFALQPGLGVAVEGVFPDAGSVGHEEPVTDFFVLVVAVLDVARGETTTGGGVLIPDRDVLLTALAAEMDSVELATAVAGNILAAIEGQEALVRCL